LPQNAFSCDTLIFRSAFPYSRQREKIKWTSSVISRDAEAIMMADESDDCRDVMRY
jgi:hypothetical protein